VKLCVQWECGRRKCEFSLSIAISSAWSSPLTLHISKFTRIRAVSLRQHGSCYKVRNYCKYSVYRVRVCLWRDQMDWKGNRLLTLMWACITRSLSFTGCFCCMLTNKCIYHNTVENNIMLPFCRHRAPSHQNAADDDDKQAGQHFHFCSIIKLSCSRVVGI